MTWTVTLKQLRDAHACIYGYNKVVRAVQGKEFTCEDAERESYIHHAHKEPIGLLDILESNNLDDALWACRCVTGKDRELRLFAVRRARSVEHLNTDLRVKACNDVAERFANGEATDEGLAAARASAWEAWAAARDARASAWEAWAAARAACASAWDARAAARAARASHAEAWDAVKTDFIKMVSEK